MWNSPEFYRNTFFHKFYFQPIFIHWISNFFYFTKCFLLSNNFFFLMNNLIDIIHFTIIDFDVKYSNFEDLKVDLKWSNIIENVYKNFFSYITYLIYFYEIFVFVLPFSNYLYISFTNMSLLLTILNIK